MGSINWRFVFSLFLVIVSSLLPFVMQFSTLSFVPIVSLVLVFSFVWSVIATVMTREPVQGEAGVSGDGPLEKITGFIVMAFVTLTGID